MPYDSFSTYGGAAGEDTGQTKASSRVAANAPERIRFMVVSGFLGAGKTTTMIALGEHMDKNHGHVGLIANDLGANLVDTNLTQTSGCTVEEIASGCICYQMDNTIDKIRRLKDRDGCVFVMSDIPGCGVGALDHTYHRLADDCADWITLSPFMVVVDPERLRMLLPEKADINLPEELVYLMKLQLEEADLVVLNKTDLLSEEEIARDVAFLEEACPDVPVMAISALEKTGIPELADYLTTHVSALKNFSVRDDEKFAEAETKLTWYNRRMFFKTLDGGKIDCNAVVDDIIEGIRMGLIERKRNVPHRGLQQVLAHRGRLRHRAHAAVHTRPQEVLHDNKRPRSVRVQAARPHRGRRDRRRVREVRAGRAGVFHGMLRHGRRRTITGSTWTWAMDLGAPAPAAWRRGRPIRREEAGSDRGREDPGRGPALLRRDPSIKRRPEHGRMRMRFCGSPQVRP